MRYFIVSYTFSDTKSLFTLECTNFRSVRSVIRGELYWNDGILESIRDNTFTIKKSKLLQKKPLHLRSKPSKKKARQNIYFRKFNYNKNKYYFPKGITEYSILGEDNYLLYKLRSSELASNEVRNKIYFNSDPKMISYLRNFLDRYDDIFMRLQIADYTIVPDCLLKTIT